MKSVRSVPRLSFLTCLEVQLFQNNLFKRLYPFSIELPLLLLQKSVDYIWTISGFSVFNYPCNIPFIYIYNAIIYIPFIYIHIIYVIPYINYIYTFVIHVSTHLLFCFIFLCWNSPSSNLLFLPIFSYNFFTRFIIFIFNELFWNFNIRISTGLLLLYILTFTYVSYFQNFCIFHTFLLDSGH